MRDHEKLSEIKLRRCAKTRRRERTRDEREDHSVEVVEAARLENPADVRIVRARVRQRRMERSVLPGGTNPARTKGGSTHKERR